MEISTNSSYSRCSVDEFTSIMRLEKKHIKKISFQNVKVLMATFSIRELLNVLRYV